MIPGDPFKGWRTPAGSAEARKLAIEKRQESMRPEQVYVGASLHGPRRDPAEVMAEALSFRPTKPPGRSG